MTLLLPRFALLASPMATVVELVQKAEGLLSEKSWSDAAQEAVTRAAVSHRHITGVDVVHSTWVVKDGKIVEFHVNVKIAYISEPAKIEK